MIKDELVSQEKKNYKFKLGSTLASSLSGFIVGFLVAAIILIPIIIWMAGNQQ